MHDKPDGPPGLPRNPIIGNLRETRRDSLGFLLSAARDYGDMVSFRFMFFPGLLVNHPDNIRHVLQDNHRSYSKQHFDYAVLKPVLGEALLTSDTIVARRCRMGLAPVQVIEAEPLITLRPTHGMKMILHPGGKD